MFPLGDTGGTSVTAAETTSLASELLAETNMPSATPVSAACDTQLVKKRKVCCCAGCCESAEVSNSIAMAEPAEVEVYGASNPVFNGRYRRVSATEWLQGKQRAGPYLYRRCAEGEAPSSHKFEDGTPFLWQQATKSEKIEWKLQVRGESNSQYLSVLRGSFPAGLGAWRAWGHSQLASAANEMSSEPLSVRALDLDGTCGACTVQESWVQPHCDDLGPLHTLTRSLANEFKDKGFIVIKAGSAGMASRAKSASSVVDRLIERIADAALRGIKPGPELMLHERGELEGLKAIRVKSQQVYVTLLSPVWRLLTEMLGSEPELPEVCQLAVAAPEACARENTQREDWRCGRHYHIDGKGKLPNGFALLVGVALRTPQPHGVQSHGGLTVFPGSHRNSGLHQSYAELYEQNEGWPDLGKPVQLRLEPGDTVVAHSLLAHRRAHNFSDESRITAYYRIRPKAAIHDKGKWQTRMPGEPFSIVPGVLGKRLETDPSIESRTCLV